MLRVWQAIAFQGTTSNRNLTAKCIVAINVSWLKTAKNETRWLAAPDEDSQAEPLLQVIVLGSAPPSPGLRR